MRFQSSLFTEPPGSSLAQAPRLLRLNLHWIIKRAMDLTGGLLLLALSWPWMLITLLRIKRRTGGSAFQNVELLGLHCRPFQARLFRGDSGLPLSWGIQRLPLLIHLVKGEMSLVGPPPVQAFEDASALQWNELRQFAYKPGLTGPWLVEAQGRPAAESAGRSGGKPGSEWTLRNDLAILCRSASLILSGSKRRSDSQARMEKGENNARSGRQRQ